MIKYPEKGNYHQSIYDLVRLIPSGRISTYGSIARALGLSNPRMVGQSLKKCMHAETPVPAHRVVNSKGELSGRASFVPPSRMQELLEGEGVEVKKHKVVDFKNLYWDPLEEL